ncbi:MAG: hypothetical protein ACXABU_07135 [Candidatus Hodarchaeales archaeon]
MVRLNIRSKKPKDTIREKIPAHEIIPSITEKTPDDSEKQFKLPPSRNIEKFALKKESVTYPTNHGIKKREEEQKTNKNYLPPVTQSKNKKESTIPSTKGSLPKSQRKKDPVNRKIPRRLPEVEDRKSTPPTRRGISKKKSDRIINTKPPQAIQDKSPKRKSSSTPITLTSKTIPKKTITNKTPPKSNIKKLPKQSKSIPPTIIKTKTPKTKIKEKKPE